MPRSLSNSTTSGRIVRYRLRPGLDFVKLLLRLGLRDEPLGSGGMGEVWKASHRLLARPAGIKLIRFDQILDRAILTKRTSSSAAMASTGTSSSFSTSESSRIPLPLRP